MTIDQAKSVTGDEEPYYTVFYRDVPEMYRFDVLEIPDDMPLIKAIWTDLAVKLNFHYRDFEINGKTYQDFYENLKDSLNIGGDTLERHLEVYEDDICKPILGRTETVTYGDKVTNASQNDTINIPQDVADNDKSDSRGKSTDSSEHTGTTKTELSDLGVRPNYESINGFLDENRTVLNTAIRIFSDCFILQKGWF